MRIKSRTALIFAAFLAFCALFPVSGFAVNLAVGSDSGNADQTLTIPITVSDPATIAGAAFTLQYSSSLSITVDSTFFDTFYNQLDDPNLNTIGDPVDLGGGSYKFPVLDDNGNQIVDDNGDAVYVTIPPVVDNISYDQPLITNTEDDGTTISHHISAARIMPAAAGGETTLFTLHVSLKSGEPSGTYDITIIPTNLNNTDAGYDAGGEDIDLLVGSDLSKAVDSGEAFPVVLSASDYNALSAPVKGHVTFADDSDGDNLPDSWEMGHFGNLFSSDGTGDYDHDGITDAQEYAGGSDPTDITSPGAVVTSIKVSFTGDDFKIGDSPAQVGDAIAVFDPDGVLCGATKVTTAGTYTLNVYGDDGSTGGAQVNDTLTFVVYDSDPGKYIDVTEGMFVPTTLNNTVTASAVPPVWTADGDGLGLNLNVTTDCTFTFNLKKGWNLFSFPLNVVYYTSENPPTVSLFNNIDAEKVDSIDDALASISGKYDIVRNFDENGSQTYIAGFGGTLKYLAGGYGYWIKMKEDATITLTGPCLKSSDSMALNVGWNLMGCWDTVAHYVGTEPTVNTPDGIVWGTSDSIGDIFASINGSYDIIRNFDENGSQTYITGFGGTLKYVSPGYGYWIKVTQNADLSY